MDETPKFSSLSAGDKLLMAGYIAGTISTLLIGLGSIFKMAGNLPGTPVAVGFGAGQPTAKPQPPTSKSNYFDIS